MEIEGGAEAGESAAAQSDIALLAVVEEIGVATFEEGIGESGIDGLVVGKPAAADDHDDGRPVGVLGGRENVHGQGHAELAAVDHVLGALEILLPCPGAGNQQEQTAEENSEECSHAKLTSGS